MAAGLKTGGRKRGTPNKMTADLKSMILGALSDAGGQDYLAAQAEANPAAFLSLVGKVLPLSIGGVPGEPIEMSITECKAEARRRVREAFTERGSDNAEQDA